MRVAVNGKSFTSANKGGALRVAVNIVEHLARARPDWQITVFVPSTSAGLQEVPEFPANVTLRVSTSRLFSSALGRTMWEQFALPRLMGREYDVLLNLANSAPVTLPVRARQILLLHDVGFLNREWFSARFSDYLTTVVRRAAARDAHFTTVSAATAEEIKQAFPAIRSVTPIYNAVEKVAAPLAEPFRSDDYVLFLSSLNPRKNIRGAIEGFQIYRSRGNADMRLVIAGSNKAIFADTGLTEADLTNVDFIGPVDGTIKWDLLRRARVLMLPSFLESFGLPILEALTVNTPVVASDLPCFRELYDDAVVYVDPSSPASIADGVSRTLSQNGTHDEARARVAARFNWTKSAEQYAALIESIVEVPAANRR